MDVRQRCNYKQKSNANCTYKHSATLVVLEVEREIFNSFKCGEYIHLAISQDMPCIPP